MILQNNINPKNVEEIIKNIHNLNGDEKELLWEWFMGKQLVGGQLIDSPEIKYTECGNCSREIPEGKTRCERCKTL